MKFLFFRISGFAMYSILSLLNFRLLSYTPSNLCFIRQLHTNRIKKVLIANRGEIAVRVRILNKNFLFFFVYSGHANGKNDGNRGFFLFNPLKPLKISRQSQSIPTSTQILCMLLLRTPRIGLAQQLPHKATLIVTKSLKLPNLPKSIQFTLVMVF